MPGRRRPTPAIESFLGALRRNATGAGAFGRRPVTSGENRSASVIPTMRKTARTGVIVA